MTIDWKSFLTQHPRVVSALVGSAAGGAIGGAFSDTGEESRGALQGALLGGVAGGLGGTALHHLAKVAPTPEGALMYGSLAGGAAGGYLGRKQMSPWLVQHLEGQGHGHKEASVATELEKKAEMEKDAELNKAFDFGMDQFFAEKGIDRAALIKAANDLGAKVDDKNLAEETIVWVASLLEEPKK